MPDLDVVRIPGSLLAALIQEAVSSRDHMQEGLLLGATQYCEQEVTEDQSEASSHMALEIDLTSYLCTGSRESFYQATGQLRPQQMQEAMADIHPAHHIMGFYTTRPFLSTSPTLRELAILRNLTQYGQDTEHVTHRRGIQERRAMRMKQNEKEQHEEQHHQQQAQGLEQIPLILFIISVNLRPMQATQCFDYTCHYLTHKQDDRTAILPPPDEEYVPAHVRECEALFGQCMDRLKALVEEVKVAETELEESRDLYHAVRSELDAEAQAKEASRNFPAAVTLTSSLHEVPATSMKACMPHGPAVKQLNTDKGNESLHDSHVTAYLQRQQRRQAVEEEKKPSSSKQKDPRADMEVVQWDDEERMQIA